MDVGFCDVEVCSNEGYEYRVEEVVEKFMEDFPSLVPVALRDLIRGAIQRSQPFNAADLKTIRIYVSWRLV